MVLQNKKHLDFSPLTQPKSSLEVPFLVAVGISGILTGNSSANHTCAQSCPENMTRRDTKDSQYGVVPCLLPSPEHKHKPGTNIYRGLKAVYGMMINQQAEELRQNKNPAPVATTTRHVIILLSDGKTVRKERQHFVLWGQSTLQTYTSQCCINYNSMAAFEPCLSVS